MKSEVKPVFPGQAELNTITQADRLMAAAVVVGGILGRINGSPDMVAQQAVRVVEALEAALIKR